MADADGEGGRASGSGSAASTSGRGSSSGGDAPPKAKKPRYFKGRCWMASDFPMSLRQLLPLLDVVGHANKHVAKVRGGAPAAAGLHGMHACMRACCYWMALLALMLQPAG